MIPARDTVHVYLTATDRHGNQTHDRNWMSYCIEWTKCEGRPNDPARHPSAPKVVPWSSPTIQTPPPSSLPWVVRTSPRTPTDHIPQQSFDFPLILSLPVPSPHLFRFPLPSPSLAAIPPQPSRPSSRPRPLPRPLSFPPLPHLTRQALAGALSPVSRRRLHPSDRAALSPRLSRLSALIVVLRKEIQILRVGGRPDRWSYHAALPVHPRGRPPPGTDAARDLSA
ncbi:hypothetical protein V8E36_002110 [Tilletia maclaganii]